MPRRPLRTAGTVALAAAVLATVALGVVRDGGPGAPGGEPPPGGGSAAVSSSPAPDGPASSSGVSAGTASPGPGGPVVEVPTLRTVPYAGLRPTVAQLERRSQRGSPNWVEDRAAGPDDWRLAHPAPGRVAGYAGSISVPPGGSLGLHLRSTAGPLRLDVFRMGRDDARHLMTLLGVAAGPQPEARPDPETGLVREDWPISATLAIPTGWPSGVYLVRLLAADGSGSYLPFVVRATAPAPVLVVIPTMTYAAYNRYGGASLYSFPGSRLRRATQVGFDRPFDRGWGAGDFFGVEFPLVAWLEDHGYDPAYAADVDVARDPALMTGARAVILSGHAEYWTRSIRDAADAAVARGVSLLGFGANSAFWQVRLAPGPAGAPDRTIVAYKDAALDPLRAGDPQGATARFGDLPRPRPARQILGQDFGGITDHLAALVLGPGMADFAPEAGLRPGRRLPGILSREVDAASDLPGAILLGATPVLAHRGTGPNFRLTAGTSLVTTASGAHLFDAGTFDWSWGLDPRYAAALPGFPAEAFARLTASILAWAGIRPKVASAPLEVGYHPGMVHPVAHPR